MLCQSVIQTIDSFRRGYDAGIRWGGSAYQPAKLHSCGKSTHRPSVTGNDIEEPQLNANATASANVADNGRRTPPSFSPKTGRATRSTAPDAAAPRSIPPSRARMSSGSSRNAVRNPSDMPVSRPSSPAANVSTKFSHLGRPAAATAKTVTAHRPRALRSILCAIAVLVAALILSVFGAWQWVDSKLNRSDWLTDTPNTPASTWLILGSDERDGSTDYGGVDNISGFRTDTILVLIKPKSGPSSLVSIPRDSLMNVDNQYMKINAVALIAGKKALVSNVEQITGQKIDHVAQIKFGGLQNVVNALGGIELCYDEDVQDSYSGLNWKAGCHTADGSTALSFSRMRYADARGDFGRNERQRQVISAIVKKASSSETLTNPSDERTHRGREDQPLHVAHHGVGVQKRHRLEWHLRQRVLVRPRLLR